MADSGGSSRSSHPPVNATAVNRPPNRGGQPLSTLPPVCRYFNSLTGCRNPDCAYRHVRNEVARLNPHSSAPGFTASEQKRSQVPCAWYLAGHCRRGEECWFSHQASVQNVRPENHGRIGLSVRTPTSVPTGAGSGRPCEPEYDYGKTNAIASSSSNGHLDSDAVGVGAAVVATRAFVSEMETEECVICMEVPQLYGLLENCDHVFCMPCLRQWRSAQRGNDELRESGVTKQCPACRTQSFFVMPSSHHKKGEQKKRAIQHHKDRLANIPCKHFESSKSGRNGPFCPFGDDCHYAHQLTRNDDRYKFNCGAAHMLNLQDDRRTRFNLGPAQIEALSSFSLGDLAAGGLDMLQDGIQEVLGMLQTYQDEEDFDPDSSWIDEVEEDDLWGLGGGTLRQFGLEMDWNNDHHHSFYDDAHPAVAAGGEGDADDDGEDYFDNQDDVDADYDDEYSNDAFGLRRAFEEGYARADEADGAGEVHSFDRGHARRVSWDDVVTTGSTSDGEEGFAAPQSSSGMRHARRSTAPSPSSSLEERIWAIRDQQAAFLGGEESFAAAQRGWEGSVSSSPSAQSPALVDGIHGFGDASDDEDEAARLDREAYMADLAEAARQSLRFESDEEGPSAVEEAFLEPTYSTDADLNDDDYEVDAVAEAEQEGDGEWYDGDDVAFAQDEVVEEGEAPALGDELPAQGPTYDHDVVGGCVVDEPDSNVPVNDDVDSGHAVYDDGGHAAHDDGDVAGYDDGDAAEYDDGDYGEYDDGDYDDYDDGYADDDDYY